VPITIVPPVSGGPLSPGQLIGWNSPFIGPFPAGSILQVQVTLDSEGTEVIGFGGIPISLNHGQFRLFDPRETEWASGQWAQQSGSSVYLQLALIEGGTGNKLDSGTSQWQWAPASNIALMPLGTQGGSQGGLTTEQAQQLANTEANTNQQQQDWANYTSVTLPSLQTALNNILSGVTSTIGSGVSAVTKTLGQLFSFTPFDQFSPDDLGTACFPDVLDVTLSPGFRYGIQMNCTSYAAWYVFAGPEDGYIKQSLGTLDIYRGGSLLRRDGLHTLTHSVLPLPGMPDIPFEAIRDFVPPDYRIVLTPSPETCWHLESLVQP
jgi:hypothetical protein